MNEQVVPSSTHSPQEPPSRPTPDKFPTMARPETQFDPILSPSRFSTERSVRNQLTPATILNVSLDQPSQDAADVTSETLPQHLLNLESWLMKTKIDSPAQNLTNLPSEKVTIVGNVDAKEFAPRSESEPKTSVTPSRFATEMIAMTRRTSSSTTKVKTHKSEIGSAGKQQDASNGTTTPSPPSSDNFTFDSRDRWASPSRFSTDRKSVIEKVHSPTTPSRFSTERAALSRIRIPSLSAGSDSTNSPKRLDADYTVIFEQGEVGLQLEPVHDLPDYVCRVSRFVDGGPILPGQARKSGKIQPGDYVIQVVADSNFIANTYDEIVNMLRNVNTQRMVTLRPAFPNKGQDNTWGESEHDAQASIDQDQRSLLSPLKPPPSPQTKLRARGDTDTHVKSPIPKPRLPLSADRGQQNISSPPSAAKRNRSKLIDRNLDPQRLQVQLFPEITSTRSHEEIVVGNNPEGKDATIQNLLEQLREMESANKKLKLEVQEMKRSLDFERLNRTAELSGKEDELYVLRVKVQELKDEMSVQESEAKASLDETMFALEEKQKVLEQMEDLLETKENDTLERVSYIESQKKKLEEEVQSLAIELEMSRSMVEGMDYHVKELEASNVDLSKRLQALQHSVDAAEKSGSESDIDYRKQIKALRTQLQETQVKASKNQALIIELQSTKENNEEEIVAIWRMLQEEKDNFSSADAKANALLTEKQALERKLEDQDAEVANLQAKNELLSRRNDALESAIGEAETELKEFRQSKESLEVELAGALSKYKEKEEFLQNKLIDKSQAFQKYKNECDSAVQNFMGDLQDKGGVQQDCLKLIESLEFEKAELSRQVGEMTDELIEARVENAGLKEEVERLEAEIETAQSEATNTQDIQLRQLESESRRSHSDYKKKEEELRTTTELLDEANKKISNMEAELKTANDKLASLKATIVSLEGEKDAINHLSHELGIELDESDREKSNLMEEKEQSEAKHRQEVQRIQNQLASLQASKSALERQLSIAEESKLNELAQSRQKVISLEMLLCEKDKELDRMVEKLSSLEADIVDLSDRNASLESVDLDQMRQQILSLELSERDLQHQMEVLSQEKGDEMAKIAETIAMQSAELEKKSADLNAAILAKKASEDTASEAIDLLETEGAKYELRLKEAADRIGVLVAEIGTLQTSNASLQEQLDEALENKSNYTELYSEKIQTLEFQVEQGEDELNSTIDILNMTKRDISLRETECRNFELKVVPSLEDKADELEEINRGLKNELQEMAANQKQAEMRVAEVESQLDDLREELSRSIEQNRHLEVEQQAYNDKVDSLNFSLAENESTKIKLTEEMAALKSQIDSLSSSKQSLENQVNELKSNADTLIDLNHKNSVLESDLGGKKKELEDAKHQLNKFSIEQTVLEAKLSRATDTACELEAALSELRETLQRKENEREASQELVVDLEARLTTCHQDIDKLKDENSLIRNEKADSDTNLSGLSEIVRTLEAANINLKGELQDKEEDFAALQKQSNDLRTKLDQSRDELETLQKEKDALFADHDLATNRLADVELKLSLATEQIATLEGGAETVRGEKQELEAQVRSFLETIELLKGNIASMEARDSEASEAIEALRVDVRSLGSRNNELEDEARTLVEANEKMRDELIKKVASLEADLHLKLEEAESVQVKLDNQMQEKLSLVEERNVIEKQLVDANAQVSSLKEMIEIHEKSNRKLNDELQNIVEEQRYLQEHVVDLEARLAQREDEISIITTKNGMEMESVKSERDGLVEKLAEYDTKFSESVEAKRALEDQVKGLLEETKDQQEKYREVEGDKLALEEQLNSLNSLQSDFEVQVEALKESNLAGVEELEKKIMLLKDEIRSKSIEVEHGMEELRLKNNEVVSLQERLEAEHENCTRLESELSDLNSANDGLTFRNGELQSLVDNTQGELETTGSVLQATVQLCQSLEDKLEELRTQLQESENRHQSELDAKDELFKKYKLDCDSVVHNLMSDSQNRGVFLHESRDMIRNLEESKASLSQQNEELSREIEEVRSEKVSLLEDLDRMKKDLMGAKNDAAETHDRLLQQLECGASEQHKLNETVILLREANEKVIALETQSDNRLKHLNEAKESIKAINEELSGMKERYIDIEAKLDASLRQKAEAIEQNTDAQARILESVKTIEDVQRENVRLQEELHLARKEILNSKESSIEAQNRLSEKLESSLKHANEILEEKIEELDEQKMLLNEAKRDISALESQLDSAKNRITDMTRTLEALENEREAIKRQSRDFEIRLRDSEIQRAAVEEGKARVESKYDDARGTIFALETKVSSLDASNKVFEREFVATRELSPQTATKSKNSVPAFVKLLGFALLIFLAFLRYNDGGSQVTFIWSEDDLRALRTRNSRTLAHEQQDEDL